MIYLWLKPIWQFPVITTKPLMMNATTVGDLKTILKRAKENNSEFVLHCGDLCNDYSSSKEFTNAFLKNEQGLKGYGIYGNHELEGRNNTMDVVTPLLTNDENVIWGTDDGKIGDGSNAYYYLDKNGYRLIFTDTNYSLNPETNEYEHNPAPSYGAKKGNININALGPQQIKWLEALLLDAAHNGLKCIVLSHAALIEDFAASSSDSYLVTELFNKANAIEPKTVIMQISGHSHIDRTELINNIVYFSVNTTTNGLWKAEKTGHYSDESLRFDLEKYDENGNLTEIENMPISGLWMSPHTHYFDVPLSANVEIDGDKIAIQGVQTDWRFGIAPEIDVESVGTGPHINSCVFRIEG